MTTTGGEPNDHLDPFWKEEFYSMPYLGLVQTRMEWVDSAHLKLPLTGVKRPVINKSQHVVYGWDENDPFLIDELIQKGKMSEDDMTSFKNLKKMHTEYSEMARDGEID
jgi:hypothetical protein